ncbi:uncharacterized protein K452DRAFT_284842 [Aplosporella prunicola CBS 121167]|uniref:Uncharacterized protein n=1 Tax=Aplosporella prunicola CBS 121167 TaxID=1176127 RepID=A0A6A6BMM3_9PEZI|nr:uncharacterized protein K452DRAFT_284842 [Aplosporella prunicola CBS 121167]KAF2144515.1 hypothetical protein K452DRAFT_284842 [Aplosporella prunicola CBS 121167]
MPFCFETVQGRSHGPTLTVQQLRDGGKWASAAVEPSSHLTSTDSAPATPLASVRLGSTGTKPKAQRSCGHSQIAVLQEQKPVSRLWGLFVPFVALRLQSGLSNLTLSNTDRRLLLSTHRANRKPIIPTPQVHSSSPLPGMPRLGLYTLVQ